MRAPVQNHSMTTSQRALYSGDKNQAFLLAPDPLIPMYRGMYGTHVFTRQTTSAPSTPLYPLDHTPPEYTAVAGTAPRMSSWQRHLAVPGTAHWTDSARRRKAAPPQLACQHSPAAWPPAGDHRAQHSPTINLHNLGVT